MLSEIFASSTSMGVILSLCGIMYVEFEILALKILVPGYPQKYQINTLKKYTGYL